MCGCGGIQECYRKIRHLQTGLYFPRRQLELSLQPDDFHEFGHHRTHISDHESHKFKSTQIRTFDNLIDHSHNRYRESLSSQWVMNLSSKLLTQPQQSVLVRELNLAVTTKCIPVPRIPASVEDVLKKARLPEDVGDRARTQIIGAPSKARTTTTNLHLSEFKAPRELHSDDSLMILPADKGSTSVVMDKTTNDAKVGNMLLDTSTYKPLPKGR